MRILNGICSINNMKRLLNVLEYIELLECNPKTIDKRDVFGYNVIGRK